MLERKRWSALARPGDWFHLARVQFLPGRLSQLHTHDFPEIFWVEAGEGAHEINGEVKRLFCGDIVFVRPDDRHVLRAMDEAGFTLVNLAFPVRMLRELGRRHGEVASLHQAAAPIPARRQLARMQLQQLKADVRRLAAAGPGHRLMLERTLLGIYLAVLPVAPEPASALPEWLERAAAAMEDPRHFARGVDAFVTLSGRSPEHLARVCRKLLGSTPTEFVNRLRMEHAARELRLGGKPIVDICLECGFSNLAHFYALFRATHGQPPLRYRAAAQRTAA